MTTFSDVAEAIRSRREKDFKDMNWVPGGYEPLPQHEYETNTEALVETLGELKREITEIRDMLEDAIKNDDFDPVYGYAIDARDRLTRLLEDKA